MIGITPGFPYMGVGRNLAYSRRAVLRGLHVQNPHSQGKLVQVIQGDVFDVAVDARRGLYRVAGKADSQEICFVQRDYRSAIEEYQVYVQKYAQGEKATTARYRVAECWFRLPDGRSHLMLRLSGPSKWHLILEEPEMV